MPTPRIDANILLRYLTDEPPEQADRVARLFQRIAAGEVRVWVEEVVLGDLLFRP